MIRDEKRDKYREENLSDAKQQRYFRGSNIFSFNVNRDIWQS